MGLRNDTNGINKWCNALEIRFRDSPSRLLLIVEAIRYIVKDVRVKKDPVDYITSILVYSKNTNLAPTELLQVLLTYKYMDGKLRRDLSRPLDLSTVASFISDLYY